MTKDIPVEQRSNGISHKGTKRRQQEQFEIVLIDIEKAAKDEVIRCIKRPLASKRNPLKYVAISYRWGEWQETLIDTGVGYTANVTSFDLKDFYRLCYMITLECDLKHIKYVWVDAICVDQTPTQRKATIYQMNNIYERATYILAVPDLHLAYLRSRSLKNDNIIKGSINHLDYLYHLINGNSDQLAALDEKFLTKSSVPQDPVLRQLLYGYTDYFMNGFMHFNEHDRYYCSLRALDHIRKTTTPDPVAVPSTVEHRDQTQPMDEPPKKNQSIDDLHQCAESVCPLTLHDQYVTRIKSNVLPFHKANWPPKIMARNTIIRESMTWMTDLMKDWASRVWVISELNIAKRKNNLKYWFLQVGPHQLMFETLLYPDVKRFTFFKFDFGAVDWSSFATMDELDMYSANQRRFTRRYTSNPMYVQFHSMMISHLHQQSFLAMMLVSKASRNEDRFYAILPQSEYKSILSNKHEVGQWNINTLCSVKLKLYEIMSVRDKLNLLFWSGNKLSSNIGKVLPTFATSALSLDAPNDYLTHYTTIAPSNFDLNSQFSIMLHCHHYQMANANSDEDEDEDDDNAHHLYCLRLKPKHYFVYDDSDLDDESDRQSLMREKRRIWTRLKINNVPPTTTTTTVSPHLDIVCIPIGGDKCMNMLRLGANICLVGSFTENKWVLDQHTRTIDHLNYRDWTLHHSSEKEKSASFAIF